jgi:dihydrolipoamide dehydrogenase
VIKKLTGGLGLLSKQRKVEYIQARAAFEDSNTLRVSRAGGGEDSLRFDRIILATGSRPAVIPSLKLDSPRMMDSTSALDLNEVPGTLLVIGGGYIGLELGTVYAALGSRVSIVEMLPGLLPGADRDLVLPLHKRMEKIFDSILLNTTVAAVKAEANGIRVIFRPVEAEPATPEAATQVPQTEKVFDKVLVSVAEAIAGHKVAFEPSAIPAVVFTDPEIAWCGLTETQAQKENREIKIAKFPWAASGRAVALDRPEGMTKLLIDPQSERVLGVGIVGVGAGDLISEGVLAIEMAAVAKDVALTIHPHPTLSETIMESAEVFFGTSTDIYRPKPR